MVTVMLMWDMHNHTTKEQAKENKEKADATSTNRPSNRTTR